MKRPEKYDMSTDYQLPPGQLWWHAEFWTTRELISIIFTSDTVKTWFDANRHAELLVRENLDFNSKMPKYSVTLWDNISDLNP